MRYTSPGGRLALVDYNRSWSEGRSGFPQIFGEKMMHEAIAGSHLTLAFRCAKQGMVTPEGVDLGAVVRGDEKLKVATTRGILYLVLREDIPLDAQHDITQWRNQDQNSNLIFHEFELIQSVVQAARKQSDLNSSVPLALVSASVMASAPVTLNASGVAGAARFVMGFVGTKHAPLLTELCDLHAALVDPQTLQVPSSIFDVLGKEANLKVTPHLNIAIVMAMWTTYSVLHRQRPTPDLANLITSNEMSNIAKNAMLCEAAETWLVEVRANLLQDL